MRQRKGFPLGQELGEVLVVDPGVGRLGELDDPRAGGVSHTPGRAATAVPMDWGWGPCRRYSAQASDLTAGETQEVGRFSHQKLAAVQGSEDDELMLCAVRQGEHASLYSARRGRTFSLTS